MLIPRLAQHPMAPIHKSIPRITSSLKTSTIPLPPPSSLTHPSFSMPLVRRSTGIAGLYLQICNTCSLKLITSNNGDTPHMGIITFIVYPILSLSLLILHKPHRSLRNAFGRLLAMLWLSSRTTTCTWFQMPSWINPIRNLVESPMTVQLSYSTECQIGYTRKKCLVPIIRCGGLLMVRISLI